MKIDNRYLIAGVALGAATLTVHGSAHAAELAGVPAPWSFIYPAILDGLAVVAWRATNSAERWRRNVARVVMVGAASASGLAQGYALADDQGHPAPLAWGMGIAPAIVVLLATVLGASREGAVAVSLDVAEPVEQPAPTDLWADYSVPMSLSPVASEATPGGDTAVEATRDTGDSDTRHGATGDAVAVAPPGDTQATGDAAAEATPSHDTGDSTADEPADADDLDPVEWLLAERRAGRDHTGVAVGRRYGRPARWGQRRIRDADERAQTRLQAVK